MLFVMVIRIVLFGGVFFIKLIVVVIKVVIFDFIFVVLCLYIILFLIFVLKGLIV